MFFPLSLAKVMVGLMPSGRDGLAASLRRHKQASRPSGSTPRLDFVIAGVQKGGTTSLDCYLRQHPGIQMADSKELHYFDSEEAFQSRPIDHTSYHRHFDWTTPGVIRGETTPIYSYWSMAIPRLWQYNPKIKLIVLLRDPLWRTWSHWQMETNRSVETESFSSAIRQEPQRSRSALPLQHRHYSYLDRGYYSEQIRRIYRCFPRDQVLFLKSEAFFANPGAALKKVFAFLEITPIEIGPLQIYNQGRYSREMLQSDKVYLRDLFCGDVAQVQSLLGWDCGDWLQVE